MILSDASPTSSPEAIDPRTLGRPMHLLPAFAARFGADLSEWLRLGPNRRYGTGLEFASATMGHLHQPVRTHRPGHAARFGAAFVAMPLRSGRNG